MVKEKNVPFRFRPELGSRIGLLPHTATSGSEMVWFTLPAFMVFHTANAWEEKDGRVQVGGCGVWAGVCGTGWDMSNALVQWAACTLRVCL
jgi:carotenoid cleavage dioxygenase-like enzyme